MAAGTTDSHPSPRTYIHPDSPSRGEVWMRQLITFDKLKLTNHDANKKGHVSKLKHYDVSCILFFGLFCYLPLPWKRLNNAFFGLFATFRFFLRWSPLKIFLLTPLSIT